MTFPFPDECPDWDPEPLPLWDRVCIEIMVIGLGLQFFTTITILYYINPWYIFFVLPMCLYIMFLWMNIMTKILNWRRK